MKSILLILLLNFSYLYGKDVPQNFYNVKYLDNYDGDTIYVEFVIFKKGDTETFIRDKVRLRNYNAEEIRNKDLKKKEIAIKQKEELKTKLINVKSIDLIDCKREKYGRMLCDLEIKN